MAFADLIFRTPSNSIVGTVQFDCFVEETHTRECEVTEHAVEEGVDIADHIRLKPDTLELRGIVSNTPLIMLASIRAPSPITTDYARVEDRAEAANRELDRIMEEAEIIDVITSLKDYSDMAITTKTVSRNAQTGKILDVSLSLKKIIKAQTKTASLPIPDEVSDTAKSDAGTKSKQDATDGQATKSQSVLSSLLSSL